ncbi:MAG: hypothetical protein IPK97_09710 [Ahniella sp.]|nr:hypothetical protein [Ahniella sp.]
MQILLMLLIVLTFVFGGAWAGFAVMALFAYILPAATILLTMTRSVAQALNPAAGLEILSLIGAPYILLAVLCFAILRRHGSQYLFRILDHDSTHCASSEACSVGLRCNTWSSLVFI